jgi:hypothetical protein
MGAAEDAIFEPAERQKQEQIATCKPYIHEAMKLAQMAIAKLDQHNYPSIPRIDTWTIEYEGEKRVTWIVAKDAMTAGEFEHYTNDTILLFGDGKLFVRERIIYSSEQERNAYREGRRLSPWRLVEITPSSGYRYKGAIHTVCASLQCIIRLGAPEDQPPPSPEPDNRGWFQKFLDFFADPDKDN